MGSEKSGSTNARTKLNLLALMALLRSGRPLVPVEPRPSARTEPSSSEKSVSTNVRTKKNLSVKMARLNKEESLVPTRRKLSVKMELSSSEKLVSIRLAKGVNGKAEAERVARAVKEEEENAP